MGSRRELQELEQKANSVTNDSLESTRRMKLLCEEAKEAGIRTVVELDDQGEKLDHIESGMTKVHTDMKQAKEFLKGMSLKGIFRGSSPLKFLGRRNSKEESNWKGNEDGKVANSNPAQRNVPFITAPTGYISRITHDSREDEMDTNLGQVSAMLANLKNMALDISLETDTQDRQIDRITQMSAANEESVKEANEKATKLLR